MNSLAQYLAYSTPRGSGQSVVSPLAQSLMGKQRTHWAELLGDLAMVGVDNWSRADKADKQASSIAQLLAGDPTMTEAAAGVPPVERTGATQANSEYEQIKQLLADSPELAPFFQAQALQKQYPDLFNDPEQLQQVWDPTQNAYVWGTPTKGQVAKPNQSEWQNAGGGVLYREGANGQLEFQRAPGAGGGGGSDWALANVNGTTMWVNTKTQEVRPVEGAPAGGGGPQGGTADERYWWTINNGDPNSPEYAAAYYNLFQTPKYIQTNDGTVPVYPEVPGWVKPPAGAAGPQQGVTPPQAGPGAPQPQAAPGPQAGAPIGGTQKGATGEAAGRVAGMEIAGKSLDEAEALLFPNGQYDPGVAFSADVPLVGGTMPFSEQGKKAYTAVYQAVDAWLRASTGAAAPDSEIRRYVDAYMPGPFDPPEAAKFKLQKLRSLIDEVRKQMRPNTTGAPAAPADDPLGLLQ